MTAGLLLGGKRHSNHEKRPTARKKNMPNQDLQQQAFAVQINNSNNSIINPETTPLAHAFYAATKTYRHQDDFPPPKSWKEILSHIYTTDLKQLSMFSNSKAHHQLVYPDYLIQ